MTIKFRRIVSFARKRTHNREKEQMLINELLPSFAVSSDDINDMTNLFGEKCDSYILEIGFGSGENILEAAKQNPSSGYIGCEVFTGGVTKLLETIQNEEVNNIRIWYNDALELIPSLPDNSLDLVYILHPDPWPKKRHNKRRLINSAFLQLLATKISPKGTLLIVTDHADYAAHIGIVVEEVKDIYLRRLNDYPSIVKTKYRLKAEDQGIESQYFCLNLK